MLGLHFDTLSAIMGEYLTAFHKHIMQLSVYQYFFVNSECLY